MLHAFHNLASPEWLRGERARSFMSRARRQFNMSAEADREYRAKAVEHLKFSIGEQWDPLIEQERDQDGRPCLTINRLDATILLVTNDARANRPGIRVSPVDSKDDVRTARMIQGHIRHIERASNADYAYDTALDAAVRQGRGWIRVLTDYVSPMGFAQELRIGRVPNPLTVFPDPRVKEADYSDMQFLFNVDRVSKDDYREQYPESDLASMADWTARGAEFPGWLEAESVQIAEYFLIDHITAEIVELPNGEVVRVEEARADGIDESLWVARRTTQVPRVSHYKINGIEIIEKPKVWPGRYIPFAPVIGKSVNINGQNHIAGIVRDAVGPQRMYNFMASYAAEVIALAPKSPFIGAEGAFEGHEAKWASANTRSMPYLQYKLRDLKGQLAPPPQRQVFEPPVQAINQARLQAADEIKAVTGIHDASMGNRSNETSGRAIRARQRQGEIANSHYLDHLGQAQRQVARVIVDALPFVITGPQSLRILGEDGKEDVVRVNEQIRKGGEDLIYDLSAGHYDVVLGSGVSYETQRQEAFDMQIELVRATPKLMDIGGDIILANSDAPGSEQLAARVKKTIAPELLEDEENEDAPKIPPQIRQQLVKMGELIDQLTEESAKASAKLEDTAEERESKERIEMAKLRTSLVLKVADLESREALAMMKGEIAMLDRRLSLLDMGRPVDGAAPVQPQPRDPEMSMIQPAGPGTDTGTYVPADVSMRPSYPQARPSNVAALADDQSLEDAGGDAGAEDTF